MLFNLLAGFAVMLLCLSLQAVFVGKCLRSYAAFKDARPGIETGWEAYCLLALVMLVMQLGNLFQITIWALLFRLLGEFDNMKTAIYHSGVNFAGLGYGDIVMSEDRRMLGPLEAVHGVLMFGVSTAVLTAAVLDVLKQKVAAAKGDDRP
ncbi:MAG TPA: ion channel [Allosphingosinicella sp.]|jgi:hypothetical protein